MKKVLIVGYSLEIGGIEKALINLLKQISNKYKITLVLEHKTGELISEVPQNVEILEYKVDNSKNIILRKCRNFINQIKFKLKYKNKFDCSISYATYSMPRKFYSKKCKQKFYTLGS